MRDIAKEANVSVATVSRLINENGPVSEETRKKVQAVIDKHNFKPNGLARSLSTKKTKMIGFLIPDITNNFFAQLCLEVERYALDLGYNVFLCNTMNDDKLESLYLEKLVERQVDGIILAGGRVNQTITDPKYVVEMRKTLSYIPVVMINGKMDGMKSYKICSDEYNAIFKITQYLINLGHRKIGLIGGISGITSFDIKKKAFIQAKDEMDFLCEDQWIIESNYSIEGGIQSMSQLLQNTQLPSAIIAINDLVAIGAIKVCDQQGVRIPEDLSIIGFDNIDLSKVIKPALTTMAHPYGELGKRAMQNVHKLVDGVVPGGDVLLDMELIIRESCKKK